MAQQPVRTQRSVGFTVGPRVIFLAIAFVLFIIWGIILLGDATLKWENALPAFASASFVASFFL